MQTEVVVPPAATVVTVAEAKRHARIALDLVDDDLDALILALIKAATLKLESMTSRVLVTQTLETTFDGRIAAARIDGVWEDYARIDYRLPRAPVRSIVEVGYTDDDGEPQLLDSSLYSPGLGVPGYVFRNRKAVPSCGWPQGRSLRVRYVAGDDPEDVRDDAKLIVNMLVAHWYDRREPIIAGTIVADLPWSVQALADSLRWGWYPQ